MHLSTMFPLVALLAIGRTGPADGAQAYARLKQLEGSWRGTYSWTGARSGGGDLTATYRVSGMGSAVIEDLTMGGKLAMSTVYHLDNGDLRATHYCAAQNQPRLKASDIDLTAGTMRFDFVDVTNLPTPDAPHVRGLTVHVIDGDHMEIVFAFTGKGKESEEHIALTRTP
jgi:hypothetical protein